MAVSNRGSQTLLFAAAGDQITEALLVSSIRWHSSTGAPGDDLSIVDPTDTTKVLYSDECTGSNFISEKGYAWPGRYFPNGLRVHVLTSGSVTIVYR